MFSFFLQHKHGQIEEDANKRHNQSAHSAGCKRKPKGFLTFANHERNETQQRGTDGKEYRYHLHIPGTHIRPARREKWPTTTDVIKLAQYIDAGIYRDATKQDKRGKTALVEVQSEKVERKEHTNIGITKMMAKGCANELNKTDDSTKIMAIITNNRAY